MYDQSYTFSQDQEKAIELLIQGKSKVDVAKALGIERKTIYNWLYHPEFKARLARESSGVVKGFKTKAVRLLNVMSDGWEHILRDPDNKSYGKVSELLLKITGILDDKPNIVFITLQSNDPYRQCIELMQQINDRVSLLSDEQKQRLLSGMTSDDTEPSVIDSNEQSRVIVDSQVANKLECDRLKESDQNNIDNQVIDSKHDYDSMYDERDDEHRVKSIKGIESAK